METTNRKQAEKALQKAKDKFAQQIRERTLELENKIRSLEELNASLKVLLKKSKEDKLELENNVLVNVQEMVAIYVEKMRQTELDEQQATFLNIIESNLNEIVSPFTRGLSLKYINLTPKEIQITNLIKHGNPSKKIAEIMKISPRTVDSHRKNIRKKIGLKKKRASLRAHFLALR